MALIGFAAAAAAAGAAIVGMTAYLAGAVGAAIEAEEAQNALETAIRITGGAAGVSAEEANEYATALSHVTRFSDDSIIAAEAVLLRFKNIGEEVFPQAIETSLDLATIMKTDASTAALTLAKALEAPGEGLLRLKTAGVVFTDAQKEQIEAMVEAGDTAGAQTLILDALATSIGGAAEAAGQTSAGKWEIFNNRLSEVQETIGMAILPVLGDLMEKYLVPLLPVIERLGVAFSQWITGVAVPAFERFLPVLEEFGQQIFQWIVNTAIPALQEFGNWFMEVALPAIIPFVQAVWSQLIPGLQQLAIWIGDIATAIMPALSVAIGFVVENWEIFAGIGAAVIAVVVAIHAPILAIIGVLVLVATAWANNWGGIQEKVEAVWAVIGPLIETAMQNIQTTITMVLTAVQTFWDAHGETILAAATAIWGAIRDYITTSINQIQEIVQFISNAIQVFWAAWGDTILAVAENTWNAILETIDNVILIIQGIVDIFVGAFTGDWELFGEGLRKVWDGVWAQVITILETAWANISEIIGHLIQEIISFFSNTDWGAVGRNIIDGIKNGITSAASGLATAAANAAAAALDAAKAFLGIDSPSRLFEEVGNSIGAGLVQGMNNFLPQVKATAASLAAGAYGGFGILPGEPFPGGGRTSHTIAPNAVDLLTNLLTSGDFTGELGAALGIHEDNPIVGSLLDLHDYLMESNLSFDQLIAATSELTKIMATGDLTGAIFQLTGLHEDSPLLSVLFDLFKYLSGGEVIAPTPRPPIYQTGGEYSYPGQNVTVGPNYISTPMTQAIFESKLRMAIGVSS